MLLTSELTGGYPGYDMMAMNQTGFCTPAVAHEVHGCCHINVRFGAHLAVAADYVEESGPLGVMAMPAAGCVHGDISVTLGVMRSGGQIVRQQEGIVCRGTG